MVPVAVVAGEYAGRSGTPMVWAVVLMSSSRLAPRPGRVADLQMRRLETSPTLAGREGRVHDRAREQGPPDREGRTTVPHEAVHEEGEVVEVPGGRLRLTRLGHHRPDHPFVGQPLARRRTGPPL